MEGMYVETTVSKKSGPKDLAMLAGISFAALIVIFLSFKYLGIFGSIVALGGAFLFYQGWLRTKIDYEYVFCDGQIDFDIIYNGAKRKNALKVELENADVVAPFDDDEIKRVHKVDKVKNFSSCDKSKRPYAIIIKQDGQVMKILFEPNDLMLEKMKYKIPRKLKLDKKIEKKEDI